MRILFLSHYFPPEVNAPALRTYEHCKYWVEQGHEVTVLSCVPHHPRGKVFPGYSNKLFHSEYKDGIRAIKVFTYITANQGFLGRSYNYLFYLIMTVLTVPFVGKQDVVISTSPQFFCGLAGYFVSRLKRAPWILEIRDLWPESIAAVGAVKSQFALGMLERMERFVYHKADRLISVTDSFVQHFRSCGVAADKISVVKNGCNLKEFVVSEADADLEQELGVSGKFVASYVGTLGMAHGLEVLVDVAERLHNEPDIVFLIVGDGAQRQNLERLIEQKSLSNIRMLGLQPKSAMPGIWALSDLSLVLLRNLPIFSKVIPSKIFESMAMGKPIVLAVKGECEEIIVNSGSGIAVQPESVEQISDAIVSLKKSPEKYHAMSMAGPGYVAEHFDRERLAAHYLEIIKSVVSP